MRYKFYREHKYVSAAFNDAERLIAQTDFTDPVQVAAVKSGFHELVELLKGHAHWEDTALHELLRKKNSPVAVTIEKDHEHFDNVQSIIGNMGKGVYL
jgi:hemerythrin-like domain-containing protein